MNKQDLEILKNLYFQAKDVFNPENPDHKHLGESLLDVAAVLHREKVLDDGMYAAECDFFDQTYSR